MAQSPWIGQRELCRVLTAEGIPSPRNGKWTPWTIQHIVTEPSYKGEAYQTGKHTHLSVKVRSKSGASYWKRANQGNPKPLGEPTPPIVDEELWDRANVALAKNKFKRAPRSGFVHWLKGRMFCRDCKYRSNLIISWRSNRWVVGCPQCQVRVRLDEIEETAWQAVLTGLDDPDILRRSLLSQADDTHINQTRTTIEALTLRELDLKSKVANLVDLIESATNPSAREAYEVRINERTKEIEEVRRSIQSLQTTLKVATERQKESETIVSRVETERANIAGADVATKARIADMVGCQAYIGRVKDSLSKSIGAFLVPAGLTVTNWHDLKGNAVPYFNHTAFVDGGKGVYDRKKR